MKRKVILVAFLVLFLGAAIFVSQKAYQIMQVRSLLAKMRIRHSGLVAYPPPPTTLEITDEELNASFALLCDVKKIIGFGQRMGFVSLEKKLPISSNAFIPCQFFRNFTIKFGAGNYSTTAQLLKPVEAKIQIKKGEISLRGERNVRVVFKEVYLDGKPAPTETVVLLENTAHKEINQILDKMEYVVIERLAISPGKITIEGIFSLEELACVFGLIAFCIF